MTLPTEATTPSMLSTVSTVVGILGGMLGAYTFIDNYILKFRPKFLIGDRIYIVYERHRKIQEYSHLKTFIIQFEIFNHRNKLGRIEDIFVRLYDSQQLEAQVLDLFPNAMLESMPTNRDDVSSIKRSPPSPIAVPNKASKTLIIEMTQEKLHTGTVNPNGFLKVQCLYKSTNGKWRVFTEFSLHAAFEEKSTYDAITVYNFDRTEKYTEREKLKNRSIGKEVNSYRGVSHYYISLWLGKAYWHAREFAKISPVTLRYIGALLTAIVRNLLSEKLTWKITKRTASRSRKPKFTVGNARNAQRTALLMNRLKTLIEKKTLELNAKAGASESINIEIAADKSIILKKKNWQVRVYVGGDGLIGVIQTPQNSPKGQMVFTLKIKEFRFGRYLWTLSDKPVFAPTIATRIVDYVALLQN